MILNAYAKLNLSLDITGKRSDGYHELDTIMQNIALCDTVTITPAEGLRVTMDNGGIDEPDNTAYAAAKAFFKQTALHGAHISIDKRIPQMSGLGGASADAAAVLIGLNRLFRTNLHIDVLMDIGKRVGADVPFSLFGGTARARGIGEKLERLHIKAPKAFVVITPHSGVSTAEAFAQYTPSTPIRMDTISYAVQKGDLELFHRYAGNALDMAALSIAPDMMTAVSALMTAGAKKALMTGSGSSVFAAFQTIVQANAVLEKITGDFALCGAYATTDTGVRIIEE